MISRVPAADLDHDRDDFGAESPPSNGQDHE
jgi:hypothetical protein